MFEFPHIVDVEGNTFVFFHDFNGVLYFSKSALTQDIEFKQTDVFRFQHAELSGRITFGW